MSNSRIGSGQGPRPESQGRTLVDPEQESLKKRFNLIEGERKAFYAEAEKTKNKNKETIETLLKENKELKRLRDELLAQKRVTTPAYSRTAMSGFHHPTDVRDENFWRKKYDEAQNLKELKKRSLLTLQEKLNEVSETLYATQEDTPLTRQIRLLENRLDKVMIKYNEALSIRKTYETIVKRLKEERVGYDNQLAAIEKSLKGKEHDFEELLLLAHDANHAKEMALTELRKYESKKEAVKDLRRTYIDEKKKALESREEMVNRLESRERVDSDRKAGDRESGGMRDPDTTGRQKSYDHPSHYDTSENRRRLGDYEEAFRRIYEATGVSDVNEIIQKFTTQDETSKALADLKQEYVDKIEELTRERNETKSKLEELKYAGSENLTRKQLDEIEKNVTTANNKCERAKAKYERISNVLVNVKAGIEHLCEKLEFFRLEGKPNINVSDETIVEALAQAVDKLRMIYSLVRNDPVFAMEERKKQNKKREGGMLTSNAGLLMNNGNFVNLNLIDRGTKIDGLERNARVRPGERGDDEVSELSLIHI
eukprot:TRINITY_DN6586_c0_g1_i1.p1 TRINITY_DN6586_c0_g1~~TRINITY_DN6586_c0_g1_i1.p1  ORF type:complete len:541 (+),score=197.99 TRINITY_DN6586_c0_g1_i1:32-1654(+)